MISISLLNVSFLQEVVLFSALLYLLSLEKNVITDHAVGKILVKIMFVLHVGTWKLILAGPHAPGMQIHVFAGVSVNFR